MNTAPLAAARPFRRLPETIGVLLWLPLILFIDSPWLAARWPHGQWTANAITLAWWAWTFARASARLRRLMVIGLLVATAGEVFFSLAVGMYEYRLGNVPVYVPPGHTIVYAAVYHFTREPWVRRHDRLLRPTLFALAALYSGGWLLLHNDVYGFACFLVFTAVLAVNRDSTTFFLAMFLLVGYLELIGTAFGNWAWHPILLNRWEAVPSGNPPAGIAVFYFGFDIGCLGIYMLSDLKRRARYDARKAARRARLRAAAAAAPAAA